MLDDWREWMNALKGSPADMETAGKSAEWLGGIVGGVLVVRVGMLTAKLAGLTAALRAAGMLSATGGGVSGLMALWGLGGAAAHSLGPEATGQILSGSGDAAGTVPGMPDVNETRRALGLAPLSAPAGVTAPHSLWDRFRSGVSGFLAPHAGSASPGVTTGSVANQIVGTARAAGASDTAIQAMLAGALGEGNINEPWKKGDGGTSFGPWQLHQGGELNRYLREGNAAGDVAAQTRYVLKRLNEIMPGFSQSTDVASQIDAQRRFEGSVYGNQPGSTYYSQNLAGAARVLRSIGAQPGGGSLIPAASAGEMPGGITPPRGFDLAMGDSIAAGLAGAGRFAERTSSQAGDRDDAGYSAVWGRSPKQVLGAIQGGNLGALRGRRIILSSGASNDPSQTALARDQIEALKAAGADVTLLGVGSGVKGYSDVNQSLYAIAADEGVPFAGELAGTEGGRVHPRDYNAVLQGLEHGVPEGYEPATAQDSHHSVEVSFVDAPPGMRTGLRRSSGPSDLTVRTQTAFQAP